ncbi:MAG: NifU family protein [Bdellovibrio sp.]|nr:NifU family protein [Bdellovibrio sp.]
MKPEELEILATPSQTPEVCFFAASISFTDRKIECHSSKEAKGSALLSGLFEFPWVSEVAVHGNRLVIKKKDTDSWPENARQVGQLIRRLHKDKIPFFSRSFLEALPHDEIRGAHGAPAFQINEANVNSELGRRIQRFLNESIAPSLAAHGGYVTLVDVHSDTAFFYFGGGCQGCAQASVTVKEGIERALLDNIPEIKKVVDVTDHKRGENPYYK